MIEIRTVIVGTKHKGKAALDALADLRKGDGVELRREPENPVDPGAVAVYTLDQHIGFIPMNANASVRAALDLGAQVTAIITAEAIIDGGEVVRGGLPRVTISWNEGEADV